MSDMNHTNLTGRLASDPRIYDKGNGVGFVLFTLASNQTYQNREGIVQKETAFLKCKAFGTRAAELKGRKQGEVISVAGRLKTESWEKDGKTHSQLILICDIVQSPHTLKSGMPVANKTDENGDGEGDPIPF
jgi:single-strand DNA-binding protein